VEESKALTDYYLAGRKLGLLRCTASLTATTISASAVLVAADLVAARGLVGAWFNLAGGLGLVALGLFLAPRIRSFGSVTFASFIGDLFGDPWLRRLASVISVAAALSWLALLVRATRLLTATVLPGTGGMWLSTLLIGAVLAYTALGGQRAVAGSDVIQLGLIILGFAALLIYVLPGLGSAWTALPAAHRSFPLAPGFGAGTLAAWALLYGLPHAVGPDIYSRLLSATDASVARKACVISGLAKMAFGIVLTLIVLASGAATPGGAGGGGGGAGSGAHEGVIFGILTSALPAPLGLLLLFALLMAFLSSVDTVLLSASSILAHDLIGPTLGGGPGAELRVARIGGVALMGTAFGLAVATDLAAVGWFGLGFALFAGSVGPPVVIALLARRGPPSKGIVRLAIGGGLAGVAAAQIFQLATGLGTMGDLVVPGVVASTLFMLAGIALRDGRPAVDPAS
jgi:SSS family solute:Na+ symporter